MWCFAKSTLEIFVEELANFGNKAALILVLMGWTVVTWHAWEESRVTLCPCAFSI